VLIKVQAGRRGSVVDSPGVVWQLFRCVTWCACTWSSARSGSCRNNNNSSSRHVGTGKIVVVVYLSGKPTAAFRSIQLKIRRLV
jgi:hypothetical protein